MTPRLLEDLWEAYSQRVLPADAGPVQCDETRRAFFSGAFGLFHLVMRQLDDEREPTEADLQVLDGLHRELEDWAEAERRRLS